jgi:hypothetical protein
MNRLERKRFTSPDETRPFTDKGYAEVINFEGGIVGRGLFEPGWRWSKHVKPIAGTDSCQASHTCYVLQGQMHIAMDDGSELDMTAGDVVVIPPGHDAWTVGDQPCVVLDFSGFEEYALPRREEPAQPSP